MPDQQWIKQAPVDIRKDVVEALITESAASIDRIILGGLPDGFELKKITRIRLHGERYDLWCYDGVPFLELRDLECATTGGDGAAGVKINAVLKYRYLKPAEVTPWSGKG